MINLFLDSNHHSTIGEEIGEVNGKDNNKMDLGKEWEVSMENSLLGISETIGKDIMPDLTLIRPMETIKKINSM